MFLHYMSLCYNACTPEHVKLFCLNKPKINVSSVLLSIRGNESTGSFTNTLKQDLRCLQDVDHRAVGGCRSQLTWWAFVLWSKVVTELKQSTQKCKLVFLLNYVMKWWLMICATLSATELNNRYINEELSITTSTKFAFSLKH